ncbi:MULTISPECIES: ABC transporter permease [Chromobacterium]|uniref:ABC transporter n=1 Tax=Chromobacterium haemolyticum TaxID=394935 RepID=A0A1W0D7V1_9NEIS|nr:MULTISPECIES: ABC transporter permease [Chromobacterium]OQS43084.1 ABC transporter [Chromobacterium haemolyticum]QOZ83954.1 ABC transporter permease [Chromobacterium sp. Rain0013]WON84101.1 ABC transporter permease [Chromobacterium haemolyticum]
MNNALLNLIITQFRQYLREPQILFWSFGFPLLLVWLLGVSFSGGEIKERTIGVVLPANVQEQAAVRAWISKVEARNQPLSSVINADEIKRGHLIRMKYRFQYYPDRESVLRGLKRGDVQVFMEPSADSGKRIYYLDPQNNEALLTYFFLGDDPDALSQAVDKNMSVLDSPGLRYIDFLVPGLVAMAVMETCLIAVGWSLIEKRATRVTRQMRITPMRKTDFLLAHVLACLVFSLLETLVLYLFASSYFDVHAQGGALPFIVLLLAGNVCFAGIAILAASRATKAQTANGLLEMTILFLVIFSGIFFSYKHFPDWMVSVIEVLPLTILADGMRMIFVEGAGVLEIARSAVVLTLIGIAGFVSGARVFRWY